MTAVQLAAIGGVARSQLTVQMPSDVTFAGGETSHGGSSETFLAAAGGVAARARTKMLSPERRCAVPMKTYRRAVGGGGSGCSDSVLIVKIGVSGVWRASRGPPLPPSHVVITATTMLARAATTAASSVCHRSKGPILGGPLAGSLTLRLPPIHAVWHRPTKGERQAADRESGRIDQGPPSLTPRSRTGSSARNRLASAIGRAAMSGPRSPTSSRARRSSRRCGCGQAEPAAAHVPSSAATMTAVTVVPSAAA